MKRHFILLALPLTLLASCESKSSSSDSAPTTVAEETTSEEVTEINLEFREGTEADGKVILTNADVESAQAAVQSSGGDTFDYVVEIKFTEKGTKIFEEYSKDSASNNLVLSVWFEGKCLCSPTINQPIYDGNVVITGNFTLEEAKDIAEKICPSEKQ